MSGDGAYSSGTYVPTNTGTYHWTASYSGDNQNNGAADACGAANETVTVRPILGGLITPPVVTAPTTPGTGGTSPPAEHRGRARAGVGWGR